MLGGEKMNEGNNRKEGLVSVVMSTYNYGQYICEALDGLKNQTYSDIEIIIIDDASTDETETIVNQWEKENDNRFENFLYLKLPRNIGSSFVLNIGFQLARGEYIVIHDSDDISHPEKIEKQVKRLIENPNVSAVGTRFQTFYDTMDRILWPAAWLKYDVKEIEENYRKTPHRHCVCFGTLLFRRTILDTLIGCRSIPGVANDISFVKDIVRQNYLVDNLNEVLFNVRIHSERHKPAYKEKKQEKRLRRTRIQGRVSVVLIVNDMSPKITKILKSILTQSYSNIEMIIIDNSTKNEIASKINKWLMLYKIFHSMENIKEIIYFKLPVSVEYPWAYNIGAYLSKGEYIVFHGENGESVRNKIEKQVSFLRNNPKHSVVGTNFNGNTPEIKFGYGIKYGYISKKTHSVNINTIMMKGYIINETMGLSRKNKDEIDFEFIYRLLYQGYKIENLKDVLYHE